VVEHRRAGEVSLQPARRQPVGHRLRRALPAAETMLRLPPADLLDCGRVTCSASWPATRRRYWTLRWTTPEPGCLPRR
jgi:hypothetical protein